MLIENLEKKVKKLEDVIERRDNAWMITFVQQKELEKVKKEILELEWK